jgi:hypothetical protein
MTDGSPLTPEHKEALEAARDRTQGFMGAAGIAGFNGWTFGIFAAVSILSGLTSIPVLLVGVGLAVVARNEIVGRRGILAFDPEAFELLWRNQVGLMVLIVAYCLWVMYNVGANPDPMLEELVAVMGEGWDELVQSLTLGVYVTVLFATVIFQGLNARYYYVRIERLRAYVAATPEWVVDIQRSAP